MTLQFFRDTTRLIGPNSGLLFAIMAGFLCLAIGATRFHFRKNSSDRKMASMLASAIREELL